MDADDTIFDFPKCEYHALREALTSSGLPFDDKIYDNFSAINSALWKQFEINKITRAELRVERFKQLIERCLRCCAESDVIADRYVEAFVVLLQHICRLLSVFFAGLQGPVFLCFIAVPSAAGYFPSR